MLILAEDGREIHDVEAMYEEGYSKGQNAARQCFQQLMRVDHETAGLKKVFGTDDYNEILENYSFKDISKKLEILDQTNFHVNDVVTAEGDTTMKGVITKIRITSYCKVAEVLWNSGHTGCYDLCLINKTGEQIDISDVLNKLSLVEVEDGD